MALLMSRSDLEAIRPAHVSMGAMKVWYYATVVATAGLAVATGLLFLGALVRTAWYLSAAAFVITWLAMSVWFGVIAVVFLRYSLRTLMIFVLVSGTIISLCVAMPFPHKGIPIVAGVFWFSALFLTVADHDPKRRERFNGPPVKPPSEEEPDA